MLAWSCVLNAYTNKTTVDFKTQHRFANSRKKPVLLEISSGWVYLKYSIHTRKKPLLLEISSGWVYLKYFIPTRKKPLLLEISSGWVYLKYFIPTNVPKNINGAPLCLCRADKLQKQTELKCSLMMHSYTYPKGSNLYASWSEQTNCRFINSPSLWQFRIPRQDSCKQHQHCVQLL